MFDKEKELKDKLDEIYNELNKMKKEEQELYIEYVEILKEKSRKNIGRCFKQLKDGKVISYCKVINIDEPISNNMGNISFNQYQYPALWFRYPYNGSSNPFYEKNLFSGAWGKGSDFIGELNKISYVEITKEEFFNKFKEINDEFVKTLNDW